MPRPVGTEQGNSMWVLLIQFQDPAFWSWCPARSPRRSRPEDRRKSLSGETGSPSPSSQREDGEPEESVRGASRSDSVGKQVSYSLAGAGGLEAGTVQRQRGAWGRWLEGPGPGGWAPGAPPGPFALPPPPFPPPPPLPARRSLPTPPRLTRHTPAARAALRPPGLRAASRCSPRGPAHTGLAVRAEAAIPRAPARGRALLTAGLLPSETHTPSCRVSVSSGCPPACPPAPSPLPGLPEPRRCHQRRLPLRTPGRRAGGSGLERWCPRAARPEGWVLSARVQPLRPGRRPQAAAHHFLQQRVPLFPASGHVLCVLARFLGTSLVEAGGRSG